MTGLINTIPFLLLAGGVAWYLYEQDKKISTIKHHTFFTLNAVISLEINSLLEAINMAEKADQKDVADKLRENLQGKIEFLAKVNGKDISEFVSFETGNNSTKES